MPIPASADATPLIMVAIVAIVIVGIVLGAAQARRRRQAMATWARSRGLSFDPSKDRGMDDRFPEFSCLRRGGSRYAENIITGHIGQHGITAFDYHFTTGSGKNRSHHHRSAVIVHTHFLMKQLFIRPEGFFDKFTEFIGFDDIDFESNEFSRKFYVKSEDRKWAFDVIHQDTMEFLLNAPTFHLEFSGHNVIAYNESRFDIEEFTVALSVIQGILNRFPKYLVRELQGAR
jgi:hypothetical protein